MLTPPYLLKVSSSSTVLWRFQRFASAGSSTGSMTTQPRFRLRQLACRPTPSVGHYADYPTTPHGSSISTGLALWLSQWLEGSCKLQQKHVPIGSVSDTEGNRTTRRQT